MPIPDKTIFGQKPKGGIITYGEVRQIKNEQEKLEVLRERLNVYLLDQNHRVAMRDDNNQPKIWSPFSVCILTLLSIETLGRIIQDEDKIKNEDKNEQSKKLVTPIYGLLDQKLLDKPTKKFYKGLEKIHGKADKKSISRYSDVIHKYQRNTFNHGFQSRGVYLDHSAEKFWTIYENEGYLIINPYLFWDKFEEIYNTKWIQILEGKDQEARKNSLNYFQKLID